jgi:hypothetical protein
MDTKKVVGAVVILVAVIGVLVVFVGLPTTQTEFHYERQYPANETKYGYIDLDIMRDTNVTITFVDDPTLMYSADVTQYTPGDHHYVYYQEWENRLQFAVSASEGATHRIQSIDIVLGTGIYYEIYIAGTADVSVVYDNGAVLGGQEFIMNAAGDLYFEFNEDVSFTDAGMTLSTPTQTNVTLVVDLPDGLNGRFEVGISRTLGSHTFSGWSSLGGDVWGTASVNEPLLDIQCIGFGTVSVNLSD